MPYLAVAHVQPDLVASVVICWALLGGATEGALLGFVGGLALDLLSGTPFGMHAFVMTMVGILAGLGASLIPRERMFLLPGVAVFCALIQQTGYVWLLRSAGWPLEWSQVLIPVVIPAALLSLLLTILLYPLVGLLHRRAAPEN